MKVKYKLFYNNILHGLFNSEMAKSEIKKNGLKNLEEIYSGEIEDENDLKICNNLFALTNGGGNEDNPLMKIQDKIRASKSHHTSMSVGDLIQIDRSGIFTQYICEDMGWEKI